MAAADRRSSRRWWTLIGAGTLICASCCLLVPLLAAAGIAGSAALLISAGRLETIGFALVALGVAGFVLMRIRARRSQDLACSPADDGPGCGCMPSDPTLPEIPSKPSGSRTARLEVGSSALGPRPDRVWLGRNRICVIRSVNSVREYARPNGVEVCHARVRVHCGSGGRRRRVGGCAGSGASRHSRRPR